MSARAHERPAPRLDARTLEATFALLKPKGRALAARFYAELFERHPAVIPLFESVDMAGQQRKLLRSLSTVVANVRKPKALATALRELGERHLSYGAEESRYAAVAETLLDVMAEFAGPAWTEKVEAAWRDALSCVSTAMLDSYAPEGRGNMGNTRRGGASTAELANELQRLRNAIDAAMTAMIHIDRDLRITYMNSASLALLKKHEATLQTVYRGFSAEKDKLLGTCIDTFHARPELQRRILGDPANLPHSTDIKVGPLRFRINVSAMRDATGSHVGCALEWADVTEVRQKETEVQRLETAIEGASTAFMMIDRDFRILYANRSTLELIRQNEPTLRQLYPGLSASTLVGTCVDMFHRNPAHQRRLIEDPNNLPYTTTIKVGPLSFKITVTAIRDADGSYIGNCLEWSDLTEQLDAEDQVERLIGKAIEGELDERIQTAKYAGFMAKLGDGVNRLMDTIVAPIRETSRIVHEMSGGNLAGRMDGEFLGEFAQLRDRFNSTLDTLKRMVGDINDSSRSIRSSSAEIAKGNQDLSQRTEEQASSLEETAATVEQLTSTVRQNADNSKEANQLAAGARDQAERGGEVVQKAVTAMSAINAASKKIADIIGVIDEIAFQTNLLALNAAVEAARAGEQGRGFAVVAAEVRNLAQRSAGAAKEIKTLIKDSVEKVDEGTRLVDQSGSTLGEIVASVKKVSDIIAEIAAASQEQATGIEQVNKVVQSLQDVTQQNASLVEEAAAASESLDDQAGKLTEMMEFFKTGEESRPSSGGGAASRAKVHPDKAPPALRRSSAKPAAETRRPAGAPRPERHPPEGSDGEWSEF